MPVKYEPLALFRAFSGRCPYRAMMIDVRELLLHENNTVKIFLVHHESATRSQIGMEGYGVAEAPPEAPYVPHERRQGGSTSPVELMIPAPFFKLKVNWGTSDAISLAL